MSEKCEMNGTKCKKDGWVKKKLGEVCEKIQNIQWTKKEDDEEYLYIDLTAVNKETNRIEQAEFVTKQNAPSRAKQIVRYNDVIFATTRPNLKRVSIIPSEYDGSICSTGFCVLRAKKSILPSWIFYNLKSQSYYDYLKPLEKGITYPAVSNSEVLEYKLRIPPIFEQQHIVSELDCLNGIIEKQKEQLKQLDELAQSIFYDMFGDPVENEKGWKVELIGDVCCLKAGKSIKANELCSEESESLYPCYGGNGIRGFINRYSHEGPYPIIGRQGALCGNVVLANGMFYATEHAVVVRPKSKFINILWLFKTLFNLHLNRLAQGVAQPGLSVKTLNQQELILPPLSLQQAFAQKIEAIEHQKELIKQSLAETENLFNSRMDYYFGWIYV